MTMTPFFETIISNLQQLDFSDSEKKNELYCGVYQVKRRVKMIGYAISINDLFIEYLLSYFYVNNNIEYPLDTESGYAPIVSKYYCSHTVKQKFIFDGEKPVLTNFYPNQENYNDAGLVTEYEMWRNIIQDREITFMVGEQTHTAPVDFNSLMTEVFTNLDEKGVFH